MEKKTIKLETANDRRNFLKTSALLAGGTVLSTMPFAGGAYAGAVNDEIKIALIGCGGRGTGAASQALNTGHNIRLVAMADAFGDQLEKCHSLLSQKYGKKVDVPPNRRFVGFDAYKKAIAEADVLLIATPPGFRPIHFEEAIKNDKHVFLEKPVATDSPGIRKVLATAEEAKRKKLNVVVGLQRHYQSSYRETMSRLHDGAIGDIVGGNVFWNSGGVWVRPRKEGQTEMEYQMRNWYYFNWLCGDHITEQHVHNIDIANWAKKGHPVKAEGTGGRQVRTGKDHGEIFDHHVVLFTYEDGTIIHSECRHFEGCHNRVDESFQGTAGRAFLSDRGNTGKLWDLKGKPLFDYKGNNDPNPYQQEHDELFAAIVAGEFKFADAENAAHSTMTSLLGRSATYSGQVINWDDAINSDISLMPESFTWDSKPKIVPDADGYYPHATPGQTQVI